ncbi:uncharacterized protein LOC128984975 [Macrosteles quadrilineatus]|uniref:uncharacterized protein LOC128984975 n=1 Tax=Macrosteles quadrilineatus TaxID=74068 RepID=UPI0023E09518|nr:uncharacterized protein LOC128984975 [Macrosteles quadrilineatus]
MPVPTKKCLKKIASDFQEKWNFPNCIGAIDGKHFRIKRPPKSGIMYRNYKGSYSINVLTVTDANYKFLFVDVGGYGKDSDGGMFGASKIGAFLESKCIDLPEECNLPNTNIVAPHVLIGDEGFPLRTYLMRPYPRRQLLPGGEKDVFNYRLARARMVVECSYGSIKTKFNVLSLPIETKVENAVVIIKAIMLFHNVIRERDGISEEEAQSFREVAEKGSKGAPRVENNSTTNQAKIIRKRFSSYFVRREGVMPHQMLL